MSKRFNYSSDKILKKENNELMICTRQSGVREFKCNMAGTCPH